MTARGAILCFLGAAIAATGAGADVTLLTGISVPLLVVGFVMAVFGRLGDEKLKRAIAPRPALARVAVDTAHGELTLARFAAVDRDAPGLFVLAKIPFAPEFVIDF